MAFKGKDILITGGLGFIGSNLAIKLVELGANVTLVDSLIPEYGCNLWNVKDIEDKVTINISDVRDIHSMKYLVKGKDYLFNLAGQTSHLDSMNDPYADLEINCRAQLSILEACRHHNPDIKIVFAGTRQIYGKPEYLPVDERHVIAPVDVNGINKTAGESYHIVYNNVYGIRSTVLRLTNTYGPRMRVKDARQTFLGIWIKQILDEEKITVYGSGQQLRDFNYVDDVVNAMLLCAETDKTNGEIYNLGCEDPLTLETLAGLMIEIAGQGEYTKIDFPEDRKSIDIGDYYADYRKIRARIGWKPEVSLEEGLRKTIQYYAENTEHYWGNDG
jgi:UDP-glucose 4-epimerase